MRDPGVTTDELPDLVAAARALVVPGQRRVLGLVGAPGAGKTTLAEHLAAALGEDAVLVSMDGFHLEDRELQRLGRHDRKGAPDTFDAAGYTALLRRLRDRRDPVVYAPRFDRTRETSIGSAVPVSSRTPLVITEGNYLLLDHPDWRGVRELLDACWFVEPDEQTRLERLVARHVVHGRSLAEAIERSHGSDGRNAALVRESRRHATRVVRVPALAVADGAPGPEHAS